MSGVITRKDLELELIRSVFCLCAQLGPVLRSCLLIMGHDSNTVYIGTVLTLVGSLNAGSVMLSYKHQ